ncbi:MAG TPA: zinc-dependent peptidase, partial [Pseudomonas sp.]|nr:zinc-dependent peptidase [Pseudomonas sp.]
MWSFRAWRRQRILARHPIEPTTWATVRRRLPILDGLTEAEEQRLRERAVLFLHRKHLTALPGVELDEVDRLAL